MVKSIVECNLHHHRQRLRLLSSMNLLTGSLVISVLIALTDGQASAYYGGVIQTKAQRLKSQLAAASSTLPSIVSDVSSSNNNLHHSQIRPRMRPSLPPPPPPPLQLPTASASPVVKVETTSNRIPLIFASTQASPLVPSSSSLNFEDVNRAGSENTFNRRSLFDDGPWQDISESLLGDDDQFQAPSSYGGGGGGGGYGGGGGGSSYGGSKGE